MATISKKNMFNEATRVQMPAMVHLTRLGYTYFGKITEDMAGTVYDPDTNILINVFKEQFARLNPTHVGEVEQTLKTIRQEYDRNDILKKDAYFERTVMTQIKAGIDKLGIASSREDRVFIQSRITKQYLDQYNHTYSVA